MTEETTNTKRGVSTTVQVVIWVFVVGLLALVAFGLRRAQNPQVVVGKTVPDFNISFYPGYEYNGLKEIKLSDLKGKVIFINVWASWCVPCSQEAPDLEKAWQALKDRGDVVFVGIDYVDTPAGANEYLTKFSITFPNAPDLRSAISSILNRNMGVPETYILDRQGVLQKIQIGPFTSADEIISVINSIQ
jgi:cytochrome c biogenesis protein CcmG/thiol:disulfide interchange protein DsbE